MVFHAVCSHLDAGAGDSVANTRMLVTGRDAAGKGLSTSTIGAGSASSSATAGIPQGRVASYRWGTWQVLGLELLSSHQDGAGRLPEDVVSVLNFGIPLRKRGELGRLQFLSQSYEFLDSLVPCEKGRCAGIGFLVSGRRAWRSSPGTASLACDQDKEGAGVETGDR